MNKRDVSADIIRIFAFFGGINAFSGKYTILR